MFFNVPLNTTFTIGKKTDGVNDLGKPKTTYSGSTTFQGHIRMMTAKESLAYAKPEFSSMHMGYSPDVTVDIEDGDRLTIGDGKFYYIVNVDDPHKLGNHLQIILGKKDE
jgi:hypothetical protein